MEAQATRILIAMDGNANFPAPNPSLSDFNNAIKNYATAMNAAKMSGVIEKEIKKEKESALVNSLRTLSNYVIATANGNRALLISSGFTISPENFSARILGSFTTFNVEPGKVSGSVVLSCNAVKHAKSYTFQYALAPVTNDTKWTAAVITKRTYTFNGLSPLKEYSFRVIATGSRDQISYSELITKGIA